MTVKNPKKSDPDYKTRFEQAVRHRDQSRLNEANRLLEELVEQDPEDPAAALVLAGIYFDMQKFDAARELFARIVQLQPRSELASRGLFHSLWKLGHHDEAFDEMRRFLAIADSEDYRKLLEDMMADLRE